MSQRLAVILYRSLWSIYWCNTVGEKHNRSTKHGAAINLSSWKSMDLDFILVVHVGYSDTGIEIAIKFSYN